MVGEDSLRRAAQSRPSIDFAFFVAHILNPYLKKLRFTPPCAGFSFAVMVDEEGPIPPFVNFLLA